jgi:hypothetical protein
MCSKGALVAGRTKISKERMIPQSVFFLVLNQYLKLNE